MTDTMIYFLVFLVTSILVTYILKREEKVGKRDSDNDLVFGFIITSYMLLQLGFRMYQGVVTIIAFAFIMFIAWGVLTLFTQSKRGSQLLNNKNLIKYELIFTSILLIVIEIISFIDTFGIGTIYSYSQSDFRNILIINIFFLSYITYIFTKRTVKFIFVENDLWRKIFIISLIIFIVIFILGTLYNIINIDRFDFYVERENYQEMSGEELWNH
ncbi:hypothetical protein [Peptoniphilus phoceensis]|uniref:hypothetical protein n=1 Tax=Peptoniphilus phoceensis TaxID=1720298 RepID=UPI000782059F|nr:hypothetical protein [Peptoniphilus phoceensis]